MPHYKCTSYNSQSADDVSPHPILLMLLMGQLTSMVGHERWVANFWQTLGSKERTLAGSQEGGRGGILVTYPSHVPRSILLPPLRWKTWKRLTGLCLSFPLNMLTLSFQSKNIQIKERHGYGNFVILIEMVAKFILARCCPRLFLQESPP